MQAVLSQIHRANMKALLLSRMNTVVIALDAVAMFVLMIVWGVEIHREGAIVSRYGACIVSFILLAITMVMSVLVQKMQPGLTLLYGHEAFCVLTLAVTAMAMGMNDVVVDLCRRKTQLAPTVCGGHVTELIAEFVICCTMMASYASTQQRIVSFIDKGILDGIKGRANNDTVQLP